MANDILVKVGADITDFSRKMAESNKALKDFASANQETFDAFKKTGAVITGAGAALAGGLGFAVKTASDFESAMSSVAAISGATGKDFDILSEKAREMGASTSFSATDSAKALEYMALAGWDTQQMLGGIGPILHLAEAGALDLGRASDLVTDSMSALGLQVSDLDNYLDKVAKTSASANTDIDALMEAFVIAGGTFERFNVPLEEANAFLGVMANRGFKGSEAGTALNTIMSRLTSTTGPARDALDELGVAAFDSEGNFRGMEAVMKDVEIALNSLNDEERAHYQTQIAGLNHGKAFSAMLSGLANEYDELKFEIENSNGALVEMRDIMKDNLQGALENLSSAFEEMMISIGTALLPAVKQLTEWLQKLADWFNGLSDSTKSTIAIVAAVAAALMLVVGPILLLIGFIPQIIAGFTTVMSVVKAVGAVFGLLVSPIGLVVLAIAGISGALVIAYQKVEWFRDSVNAVWEGIKETTLTVFEAIKEAIFSAIDAVVSFIQEKLETIRQFWTENGEQIRQAADNVWNFIRGIIKTVMPIIETIISTVWKGVQLLVKAVWNNIKGVIDGALNVILGLVKTFSSLFTGDWNGVWEGVKQILSGAVEFIWNFVQLMFWGRLIKGLATFATAFRGAMGNLWTAIQGIFTGAINAIRNFFVNGFNAMRNVANTSMNSIRSLISRVWNTIRNVFSTVVNAVRNTVQTGFNNVVTAIRNAMTNALNSVRNILTNMVNAIRDGVSRFFSAGRDLIRGLIDGIKNMGAAALNAITGVVDGVVNKAKSLLGIASPSKVMAEIGRFVGDGLILGMAEREDEVEQQASRLAEAVNTPILSIKDTVKDVASSLSSFGRSSSARGGGGTIGYNPDGSIAWNSVGRNNSKQAGKDTIDGFSDGVRETAKKAVDTVKNVADRVKDTFKDALGIKSPSRIFRDFGEYLMLGWINGINSMRNAIMRLTEDMTEWMTPDVRSISMAYEVPNVRRSSVANVRELQDGVESGGGFNPTFINHFTPAESTPSESARKQKEMMRRAAMEWGI